MQNDERPASSGLSRRTLVKSAAWSAPVIAVAAATPAAAASTAGFEVYALVESEMGSKFPIYNPDFTTKYRVPEPYGFYLLNSGTEDWAGGATVTFTYDKRMYDPFGAETRWGADGNRQSSELDVTIVETTGDVGKATLTVPNPVPAGTTDISSPTAVLVHMYYRITVRYPDDGLDGPLDSSWTITVPGNTGGEVLTCGPLAATERDAVATWGLLPSGESSATTVGDCSISVLDQATVTSVGPSATPGNVYATVSIDPGVISDVTLSAATLDSADVTSQVTIAPVEGNSEMWRLDLPQPLAADSEFAVSFAYTYIENGTPMYPYSSSSGANFRSENEDAADQRLTNSPINSDQPICEP